MSATPLALALILLSSLCWSGLDLSRKLLVERIPPLPLLFLLTVVQIPLFAAWVWLEPGLAVAPGYWAPALGSVALNVGANVCFLLAMVLSPLSVTIPLLSLVPVFVTLSAIPMLGELPGPVEGLGILLVVAGAFALSLERLEGATLCKLLRSLGRETGSLLMMLVALLWALALPLDKLAMAHAPASFHALVLAVGVTLGALVLTVARGELRQVRRLEDAPGLFVLATVVGTVALGAQLLALPLAWVSLVETIKRTIGNTLALAFGHWLLGEPLSVAKVSAVLAMALGVALVLL